MAFELRLTITGLCMFVPGDGTDPVLHVLMPEPCSLPGHAGHDHGVAHRAVLMYDRVYHPAGEGPSGNSRCVPVPLDGCAVKVQGANNPSAQPTVSETEVPRIYETSEFAGVSRACVNVPLDARVHTRIELRGTGSAVDYSGTPAIQHVHFVLGRFENGVELDKILIPVPGTKAPPIHEGRLYPPDGIGSVDLRIAHVVDGAVGPICAGDASPDGPESHHFWMYYCLADAPKGGAHAMVPGPDALLKSKADPSFICSPSQARFAPPSS